MRSAITRIKPLVTVKIAESAAPEARSIAPMGFAILREGRLCRYLTPEQAVAVGLLINKPGRATIDLRDRHGEAASWN